MDEKETQKMDVDLGDEIVRTASAQVQTDKAMRYLKALCNHFKRKVEASYEGNHGVAYFPFGKCAMEATDEALLIEVFAPSEELLGRVKFVVADHLIRFGEKDELQIEWDIKM